MTKAPVPKMIQKQAWQHKNPPETSTAQRLRADLGRSVGCNDSHLNGVVKPVNDIPTFPLTTKAV